MVFNSFKDNLYGVEWCMTSQKLTWRNYLTGQDNQKEQDELSTWQKFSLLEQIDGKKLATLCSDDSTQILLKLTWSIIQVYIRVCPIISQVQSFVTSHFSTIWCCCPYTLHVHAFKIIWFKNSVLVCYTAFNKYMYMLQAKIKTRIKFFNLQ